MACSRNIINIVSVQFIRADVIVNKILSPSIPSVKIEAYAYFNRNLHLSLNIIFS